MSKVSVMMHLTQAELSILHSALHRRAQIALELAQDLKGREADGAARAVYATYASTAALATRIGKHLDNLRNSNES